LLSGLYILEGLDCISHHPEQSFTHKIKNTSDSTENEYLLPSIDIVQRLMKVFAVSADNLLNDSEDSVVELQNHELSEQLMLINQLDEDERNALIKIINSMLTKKRMKDLLDGKVNF